LNIAERKENKQINKKQEQSINTVGDRSAHRLGGITCEIQHYALTLDST